MGRACDLCTGKVSIAPPRHSHPTAAIERFSDIQSSLLPTASFETTRTRVEFRQSQNPDAAAFFLAWHAARRRDDALSLTTSVEICVARRSRMSMVVILKDFICEWKGNNSFVYMSKITSTSLRK